LDAPFAIDRFESNETNIERSIMTEEPGATPRKLADLAPNVRLQNFISL
jgi:hypothetical protein